MSGSPTDPRDALAKKAHSSPFGAEMSPDGIAAIPLWINGHAYLTMPEDGFFDIVPVGAESPLRRVPLCGRDAVDAAVAAAETAAPQWASLPPEERRAVFSRLRDSLQHYATHLGKLLTEECSLDAAKAQTEVMHAAASLDLILDSTPPLAAAGRIVAIVNMADAPFAGPARRLFEALAAGCAVVLKPSVRCPSALLALAELAGRAGVPDGLVNVVHGDTRAALAVCGHPGLAATVCVGDPSAVAVLRAQAGAGDKVVADGGEMRADWPAMLFP